MYKYTERFVLFVTGKYISEEWQVCLALERSLFRCRTKAFWRFWCQIFSLRVLVFHFLEMYGFLELIMSLSVNWNVNRFFRSPYTWAGNKRFSAIRKCNLSFWQLSARFIPVDIPIDSATSVVIGLLRRVWTECWLCRHVNAGLAADTVVLTLLLQYIFVGKASIS